MKVTIIYDNEVSKPGLKADWGFSALIEIENTPPILFDTVDYFIYLTEFLSEVMTGICGIFQ